MHGSLRSSSRPGVHRGNAKAAEIVGLAQPRLSNLLRGEFHGVSERRLMDCLTRLGRDVDIVIKEKPRSGPNGRLSVVVS